MEGLADEVDRVAAATGFSGVVRVDLGGATVVARAYGFADRAHGVAATIDTRFGVASGTKGLTALTVMSLVEEGRLGLETPARAHLGDDLPLIGDDVTIAHLLAHRSGIGDYIDEDDDAQPLPVGVDVLDTTEAYLQVLDGHPARFPPGTRFAYCNSGYVVLALIAERAAGSAFHDLVHERVLRPAGMHDTAFLRSDELPARAARGYLDADGLRTNVFHLPVRGSGDGGVYTTAADVHALWKALLAGRIVSPDGVARMLTAHSAPAQGTRRYGLGFWLAPEGPGITLEGLDAGVSFRSVHDPAAQHTHTVIANTARGAWALARRLDEVVAGDAVR